MLVEVEKPSREKLRLLCLLLATCFSATSLAEMDLSARKPTATPPIASISSMATLNKPAPRGPDDQIYRTYFAQHDNQIRWTYYDRWNYQEHYLKYSKSSWRYEHIDIGTMSTLGNAPYEGDVRQELARTVFRWRLNTAIRKYLKGFKKAGRSIEKARRSFQKVQNTLDTIKNSSISLSKAPTAGKIRYGFDVLNDVAKIEYLKGGLRLSCFHNRFLDSLMGQSNHTDNLVLTATDNKPGFGLSHVSLTILPQTGNISTTVGKRIAPRMMSNITTNVPLGLGETAVSMNFSYQF